MKFSQVAMHYIGCEVYDEDCPNGSKSYLDQIDSAGECIVNYYREVDGEEICDTEPLMMSLIDVKPILRKLEDMTAEDANGYAMLYVTMDDYKVLNAKIVNNPYIGYQVVHDVELNGKIVSNGIKCQANYFTGIQFHYLCQRGYDLFGLIDSGEAIDYKTVKK